MCRLFGFVSHKPVAVTHLLEEIYESFVKISHLHDGWGLAWYDENDHFVERDTLRVTVIDVALNSRNSIQEQYKSVLQR